MKKARFMALLMALLLLAGCASDKGGTQETGTTQPEVTDACLTATGFAPEQEAMTINGVSIPMGLYVFLLCDNAAYVEEYSGVAFSDNAELRSYVQEQTLEMLRQQAIVEQLAQEYDVTLSEETTAYLAEQHTADIDYFGSEAEYERQLLLRGLTPELWDRLSAAGYLYLQLNELTAQEGSALYLSRDELLSYAREKNYVTADHILLLTQDASTGGSLDEETVKKQRALADDLHAQLAASDDPVALFDQLADEYGEDPGRESNPNGYTLCETDSFVDEFKAAALALEENAFSDVVETTYGYHILLRRPLDEDAACDTVRERLFNERITDAMADAQITYCDGFDSLDPMKIYETVSAAQ